jgi:3-deoxy-7-phosphoheptulonate synthase
MVKDTWHPGSWRDYRCEQLPDYPDKTVLEQVEGELRKCAPLTFAGEMRDLQAQLAEAQKGNGFLLMGGDCAESFDEFSTDHIRDTMRVILQMALVITYGSGQPVIKIGRMAGQFAKPRSSPVEKVKMDDGSEVELPSYKGDNVNLDEPTLEARIPNPQLMLRAYHQCAQTLNILRAFVGGGYADLSRLQEWNLDFVQKSPQGSKYRMLATKVEEAMRFIKAIGIDTQGGQFKTTSFYTAHECLLLQYEEALTREDSTSVRADSTGPGNFYGCSANMLWIGERTRQLDCGHLQFVRGLKNPLGVKISNKCENDELIELLDIINPDNTPGRVTLIIRMGNENIREHLPRLIEAVESAGKNVLWISDPVHGNTITAANGKKTRPVGRIMDEINGFFEVHQNMGTHPGGVHLEMTGESVTECVGGTIDEITEEGLNKAYKTHCDPRLNGEQALEIAFQISERFREINELPDLCVDPTDEDCSW